MSAFYVLSVPPEPTAQDSLPVVLGLGPVTLPGYLDRSQIVIRMSENQVALAEWDRWAEPLDENILRVLEQNLVRLLPGSSYTAFPWYDAAGPDYGVAIEIGRFEADTLGHVVLDATWVVSRGDELIQVGSSLIEETSSGPARVETVAAQSRALARMSGEIAAAVRRAHARSRPASTPDS
jgi:uncharacterized lipoprotein YmbA